MVLFQKGSFQSHLHSGATAIGVEMTDLSKMKN